MVHIVKSCPAIGLALTVLAGCASAEVGSAPKIRVLLITGQQNHDWAYTSTVHQKTLQDTGIFAVDITTTPVTTLSDATKLKDYQVFFLDYNGERWGPAAEKNFLSAVEGGTGVVCVHASNNSFIGWGEYEKLVGLVWIPGTTGHGKFHSFDVNYVTSDHPITRGLSGMKAHPDELYHTLVNTQKAEFTVLASAFSTTESNGTGKDEPMALVSTYGKGRMFHTPLGHVWPKEEATRVSINDGQFKTLITRGTEWAATGNVTLPATWTGPIVPLAAAQPERAPDRKPAVAVPNMLTEDEKAAGWALLFDGKSTPKFRGFKKDKFPEKGWEVTSDGLLHVMKGGGGGDVITLDQYENFEFACDWKVAPGGNSGIIYLSTEENFDYCWQTGPEMQILDNAAHNDGKNTSTSAGALYALYACTQDVCKPAGEWNSAVVKIHNRKVEHWLNGVKVVEAQIGSDDWNAKVQASKFKEMPAFGTKKKGHLALQDHGDDVWFRNIKVRVIGEARTVVPEK